MKTVFYMLTAFSELWEDILLGKWIWSKINSNKWQKENLLTDDEISIRYYHHICLCLCVWVFVHICNQFLVSPLVPLLRGPSFFSFTISDYVCTHTQTNTSLLFGDGVNKRFCQHGWEKLGDPESASPNMMHTQHAPHLMCEIRSHLQSVAET